jgi:DNA replication protein DnaC
LSKEGAELLFQFFADRYEKGSIIITSNLEFSDWTNFMGDITMTSALLDRLTHHCYIFTINGESYRFKQSMQKRG